MGQSALSLVGIANSRYKSSLLNERAECMTSLPYTNRSPLLLSQSFLVISYTISSPCSILSVPSNFLLFCFIWLVTLPPHPPPLNFVLFWTNLCPNLSRKHCRILWVTWRNLKDLSNVTPLLTRSIRNLCCFVVIKIIWLFLGLYCLCPRK